MLEQKEAQILAVIMKNWGISVRNLVRIYSRVLQRKREILVLRV
jgi:hypothetical protein